MNGNSRLYRSVSEGMLGGVAAGLGNYFKIDPVFVRLGFLLATFMTGGAFLIVYLAMWLLIPTAGSTTTEANRIIQENLNEMGAKVRSFVGARSNAGPTNGSAAHSNVSGNATASTHNQTQIPQAGGVAQTRQGLAPVVLILVGVFFLLANLGFFRGIHWGMWWPLMLVGLGAIMLTRRR